MRKYIKSTDPIDIQEKTLMFESDLPSGGMVLCCGICDSRIEIHDNDENCPNCKGDLLFPTWCAWRYLYEKRSIVVN